MAERVFLAGRSARVQACTRTARAECAACGQLSRQAPSRYELRVADTTPGGGMTIRFRQR